MTTTHPKLYSVWAVMKQRCYNPKCKIYEHYGARGIVVEEPWCWQNGAEPFIAWALANGYQPGLTLDRINNDGNYSPENCRWVTRADNLRNRRMTPKWAAHIERMRHAARSAPRTEAQRAAGRLNMAIARQTKFKRLAALRAA